MSADTQSSLRQELKSWEQAFLLQHGRKPSRTDIKNDQSIAEKYKCFNRARNARDPQLTPRKSYPSTKPVLAEASINTTLCTPTKSSTPRRQRVVDLLPLPTPMHIKFALGPTPQKDGHILGLFDGLISPGQGNENAAVVVSTPGRDIEQSNFEGKHSRTPQSSSKRYYLDAFAGTPLKRKRSIDDAGGTPGSSKRTFATPAFLRREVSMPELSAAPVARQRPKPGLVRSLSTIIANLRKNEEEKMDEEWDIMREMENESADEEGHNVEVETHDAPMIALDDMPLGPDRAPEEEQNEVDSKSARKVWKKRGLKRQTKKVNMKPVLHAPQKAAELQDDAEKQPVSVAQDIGTVVKKAARKVNEAAHMNFRRLKIKNKNSKASGRGRFGRR